MSIASEIERLSGVRGDIFTSITNKGVTVPVGSTFSSCPSLIDQIEGGGGSATSMINSWFTASGYVSGYRPFTATQNIVTEKEYEERVESWTGPVTSQAGNRILIAVPSASIASFYENNSANNPDKPIQSIINLYYTASNPGSIHVTAYMVPQSNYAPGGNNTFYSGDVIINWPVPTSAQISFNMNSMYNVLAANSASWQWTIQNGTVYIGLQDAWYQFGSSVTELEVSSLYDAVTATTTAYPYPSYPTTTTGYVTNYVTGREFFVKNGLLPFARYEATIAHSGYKNIVYDNSPEGGSESFAMDVYSITAFSSKMLKNNITAKTNYNVNSTAYSYNYGTTQTAYSGFEGV